MKILIATPSASGLVTSKWSQHWANLLLSLQKRHQVGHLFVDRALIDNARNEMIRYARKDDADYVFFLDDDTFIDADGVQKLIDLDKDISSPPVPCRKGTDWLNIFDLNCKNIRRADMEGTMRVGAIGMASTLIKRRVIDGMLDEYLKPFEFQTARDLGGKPVYLSEDVSFCYRAAKLGFETWAVAGIKTMHMGDHNFHAYDG